MIRPLLALATAAAAVVVAAPSASATCMEWHRPLPPDNLTFYTCSAPGGPAYTYCSHDSDLYWLPCQG